jgi:DNA invertase Pin-like site-specific DNA recombinase
MKIAIYARVSTDEQNVDMQVTELRAYCVARGWNIVHEYVDKGVSGAKANRPQLDRLMSAASKRQFDAVLVWKLDRFGRSVRHLVTAVATLEEHGVAFISVRDNIDMTTPAGRLMFNVIAAMAQFERELTIERVKAGMAAARARGKHIGRQPFVVEPSQVASLKASGATWEDVSDALGCSISTCQRAYRNTLDSAAL